MPCPYLRLLGVVAVEVDTGDLLAVLAGVPDPRKTRSRRHPLGYVLAVAFSAFMVPGFESLVAVAQWAGARSREELLALRAWPDRFDGAVVAPSEKTIRWVLTTMDPDALMTACAAWTLARGGGSGLPEDGGEVLVARLRAVAMDGKCARSAKAEDGSMPMFMSALAHQVPVVLAQTQIPDTTCEIAAVSTLLTTLTAAGWDLPSTVITLDTLHTVRATATAVTAVGAHYVMTVKGNRARLRAACAATFTRHHDTAKAHHTSGRGHGRTEERHHSAVTLTQPTTSPSPTPARSCAWSVIAVA